MKLLVLLGMCFCHLIADYNLQGILAQMKQKTWWEKNVPHAYLYKHDYIIALIEHSFIWAFLTFAPLGIYMYFTNEVNWAVITALLILIHTCAHAMIDNEKANRYKINLVADQLLHFVQIFITWLIIIL